MRNREYDHGRGLALIKGSQKEARTLLGWPRGLPVGPTLIAYRVSRPQLARNEYWSERRRAYRDGPAVTGGEDSVKIGGVQSGGHGIE